MKILSNSTTDKAIIDSLNYQKIHTDLKSISDEIIKINQQLFQKGFLQSEYNDLKKENDSVFNSTFNLGKRTNFIHIYIGDNNSLLGSKKTESVPIQNTESFLNNCLAILEKKGYSLARIQLTNFTTKKDELYADLSVKIEIKRTLDDIVINGYEKFPKSHIVNLKRLYRKKIFNQETLKKVSADLNKFRFIEQTKSPEILFTKDSTKVFIYLKKTKPNTFDGYLGFNNNDGNFTLNGYVDLKLQNILNSGEKFSLYWKNNGNKQTTFDASIEIPYIFKSRLGIKAQLNIFKQDSTFQNAKTALDLGYFFNYNTRIYLGYQNTESSDIQNKNITTLSDYTTSFLTSQLEYLNYSTNDYLFPEKTTLNFKMGFGSRETSLVKSSQYFVNFNLYNNFYLNKKNIINLKSQNYYLKSDDYIINELYRFGGINSIRGFNENSLQANFFTSILTEYRYKFNDSFYLHSITDYGYFQDKATSNSDTLTSFGFGFGLLSKNGLFNFVYANGSSKNQAIKLSNSIVHVSFKVRF